MGRLTKWLVCAAGTLALAAFGVVDTAGQEVKAVPKPAVKVEPAKAVVAFAVNDAVVVQWEQHFGPQIRQLYRTELHFMRVVCEPTKPQFDAVAADCEATVKAAIRKTVEGMHSGNQSDPRAAFAETVAKSVRANLAPDQATRYEKELDLRTAARKRLVVLNLVAMVDKFLVLTADQRERLDDILTSNWNEAWNQTQMLLYTGQYLPQLPDAQVVPILTDAQRTVWRGIPKTTMRFGVNFGVVQGLEVEDEVWDEKDKAAPKNPGAPKAVEKR